MKKIKLAIAEDHPIFREGLVWVLERSDDIEVCIKAINGKELIEQIKIRRPDVVLMDLKMPEMDGVEATIHIKQKYPDIKIIILSMYDGEFTIANLMKKGANSYLVKSADPNEIKKAIYSVMEKGYYYSDYISEAMHKGLSGLKKLKPAFDYDSGLSQQEHRVLELICHGFTTSDIADKMNLCFKTIEGYRTKLHEKLCVKNTAQLIILALENDLVDLDFRVKNSFTLNK